MKKISVGLTALVALVPSVTFAASVKDFPGLIAELVKIANLLIPFIFALAVLVFLWGVMKYMIASDVNKKAEGRTFIVYGIIGLAVMLSVWGLAFFVKNSFFENSPLPYSTGTGDPEEPCIDPSALGC